MSLYRKYRPLSFADVVGQDAVVTTLEQAAKQDKLTHAYLFAGSRGTGKTSVARILAKILMTHGIEDEALQKQIIKGVEDGNLVDLLEIDAASNRGIDDVRDLIEKIQFSPVVSTAKVYIIDEVHMLTKEAFNALLKTLEEPPSYAYFILATTELNKIPSTIQSRCQCFTFRRVPQEDIVRRLQYIADQERIPVERDALRVMANHVQGGMRDAISILDQMRSLPKITAEDVELRIGTKGDEFAEPIFQAIVEKNPQAILETIRKAEEAGIALDLFLQKLLSVVRTTLHKAVEEKQPIDALQHMQKALLMATRDVRTAPVPGLVLESALLSLMQPQNDAPKATPVTDFALPAKEKKEPKKTVTNASTDKADEPVKENAKEEAKKETDEKKGVIEARDLSLESLQDVWADVVKETTPASVKMSLKNGRLLALEDTTLTLGFSSAFHKNKVAHPEAARNIEEIMKRIFARNLKIDCIVGESEKESINEESSVDLAEAAAEIF